MLTCAARCGVRQHIGEWLFCQPSPTPARMLTSETIASGQLNDDGGDVTLLMRQSDWRTSALSSNELEGTATVTIRNDSVLYVTQCSTKRCTHPQLIVRRERRGVMMVARNVHLTGTLLTSTTTDQPNTATMAQPAGALS